MSILNWRTIAEVKKGEGGMKFVKFSMNLPGDLREKSCWLGPEKRREYIL